MILDTCFLIDLFANRQEAVNLAKELELKEIIKTTSINVFEIYRSLNKKDKLDEIEKIFESIIVLNLDKKSAKLAGEISQELAKSGMEIDPEDCMIGAITILANETLVTRNIKHFSRIKKINLKLY